ncbi:hypothetical protein CCMSSC00406_0008423 [Pleurotus cornucopiae]|uniref:Uncharacterized protein n=1 Tax=Pleurotus cornucopiae TaxID=5321 RepID=A0ACB7JBE6_PLECO|nr:hypothetical protein CCMSSC00406_0008423 [Pleurotus cornucopiae]
MNPAMMASYGGGGNKFGYGGGGVNPSQLMGGMGMEGMGMGGMGMGNMNGLGAMSGMGGMNNVNGMGVGGMGGMGMNGGHQNAQMLQQQGFGNMNGSGMGNVGGMGMGMDGMNAMGNMGMGGMGGGMGGMGMATINPAALGGNAASANMSGMNPMGGMGNMGGMGMSMGGMNQGMNPNATGMSHGMNMGMNMGMNANMGSMGGMSTPNATSNHPNNANMNGGIAMNPTPNSHHSNHAGGSSLNMGANSHNQSMNNMNMNAQLNMNMMQLLQNMGLTKQQFMQLPPQDKQMIQAKVMSATQAQQMQMRNQGQGGQQHTQPGQIQIGQGMNPQVGQGQVQQMQDGGHIHQPVPAGDGIPSLSHPRSASAASGAGGQFYDRPSSSASMHSQAQPTSNGGSGMGSQQMMPPPRPPTAQGQRSMGQQMSRPGTSHSHHSPSASNGSGQGRPPSRAASVNDFGPGTSTPMHAPQGQTQGGGMGMPNGKPPTPSGSFTNGTQMPFQQQPQQHQQQMNMHMQGHAGSPPPGSPNRKRKAGLDSPRIGSVDSLPGQMGMGMMGPPVLPRQQSGGGEGQVVPMTPQMGQMNGMPVPPRPQSSNGMIPPQGARINAQMAQNMSMGAINAGMAPAAMMGIPMDPGTPQRQSSIPPQTPGFTGTQTPRQPSLPPPGTPQKMQQEALAINAVGVNVGPIVTPRSSLPPSGGAPSVASTSQVPQQPAVIPQLPPLPANVSLNPAVTRVTVVPLVDSTKLIATLTEAEIEDIKAWMKVDKEYDGVYRKMKDKMGEELRETFGPASLAWWEKGSLTTNASRFRRGREQFDIRYPGVRREPRDRKKVPRREGLRLPRRLKVEDADRPEELVPIRLEFDVEQHHKMRDTFVWNLNDPVVTPESFAQSVVDDYGLGASYHSIIVKSIQEQLSDYKAHSSNYDGDEKQIVLEEPPLLKGTLCTEDLAWWESWRKRMRSQYRGSSARKKFGSKSRKRRKVADLLTPGDAANDEDSKQLESSGPDVTVVEEPSIYEDMRILIKLDIIVGSIKLDDQFEWDLDNTDASPEEFAEVYARELGLVGEFKTAIAHSIREQVQAYQKSLFLIGHPSDGALVQDDDLRMSFLPSLTSGARSISEVQAFTPLLNYLSDGEIEKNEKERDKDMNKRRKRATRGRRGVALPDREPIRTYRTPAIGFPELDPATLAAAIAAAAPTSRRAAAAAASLTIANMVASENGTAFISPQSLPTAPQPTPAQSKEKKPKGLFKPPPLPETVLLPRAQVTAPTPSTAADVTKLPAPLENDPPMDPIEPPVSAAQQPPDSRFSKVMTAKRVKELEREAKEKEFADGQHPNYIDGVWHCSNCGCPESIAVGRRKGPLGDKSQCGTCGKFWHRHRRPRPVEYNTSLDFHQGVKKEAETAKTGVKKKGGAAALRAQSTTLPNTPSELPSEPPTPARNDKADVDVSLPPTEEQDRPMSPVSTASSASEPPLSQRVRANGTIPHVSPPAPAPSTRHASPAPPTRPNPSVVPVVEIPTTSSSSSPSKTYAPNWLTAAMQAMQAKYTNDKFEVILRKVTASTTPEWRIKCLDCPGKLYTPGPGETLSNYEVHLKNRQHRQRVNERLNGSSAS